MKTERREYPLDISFNNRSFSLAIIDSHFEVKHPEITDRLILDLIAHLDRSNIEPVDESGGFKYFAFEIRYLGKPYRMVLTYCDEDFLGVINVFRVKEKKK